MELGPRPRSASVGSLDITESVPVGSVNDGGAQELRKRNQHVYKKPMMLVSPENDHAKPDLIEK